MPDGVWSPAIQPGFRGRICGSPSFRFNPGGTWRREWSYIGNPNRQWRLPRNTDSGTSPNGSSRTSRTVRWQKKYWRISRRCGLLAAVGRRLELNCGIAQASARRGPHALVLGVELAAQQRDQRHQVHPYQQRDAGRDTAVEHVVVGQMADVPAESG